MARQVTIFGFTPNGRGGIAEWEGALDALADVPVAILVRYEDRAAIASAVLGAGCVGTTVAVTGYMHRMRREVISVRQVDTKVLLGTAAFVMPGVEGRDA